MIIDNVVFAREQGSIARTLPLATMTRLYNMLYEGADVVGEVHFQLQGQMTNQHGFWQPMLFLSMQGSLTLICQRCLEGLPWALEVQRTFLLVKSLEDEHQQDDWAEDIERLEISAEMSVSDFIEDEIILSLPVVPRHEHCHLPVVMEEQHDSPFSILRH